MFYQMKGMVQLVGNINFQLGSTLFAPEKSLGSLRKLRLHIYLSYQSSVDISLAPKYRKTRFDLFISYQM